MKRLIFPANLESRVCDLLIEGFYRRVVQAGRSIPGEDKVIHDIVSDFLGQERRFDSFRPDESELDYYRKLSKDELLDTVARLLDGQAVIEIR